MSRTLTLPSGRELTVLDVADVTNRQRRPVVTAQHAFLGSPAGAVVHAAARGVETDPGEQAAAVAASAAQIEALEDAALAVFVAGDVDPQDLSLADYDALRGRAAVFTRELLTPFAATDDPSGPTPPSGSSATL